MLSEGGCRWRSHRVAHLLGGVGAEEGLWVTGMYRGDGDPASVLGAGADEAW